jgi:Sec-independent protein secretion pathway component TatC
MVLMAIPLLALYELSISISARVKRKRDKQEALEAGQ